MKNFAFSLIELMVVIAIVALLAAVAVPAYNNYIMKARLSADGTLVQSTITKSIEYYNATGTFGLVAETGLTADGSDPTLTNYTAGKLNDTLAFVSIGANSPTPGVCNYQTISAYYTDFGNGDAFNDPPGDVVMTQYNLIDIDGIITVRCSSGYSTGGNISNPNSVTGTPIGGDFVANCPNISDDIAYYNETIDMIFNACD